MTNPKPDREVGIKCSSCCPADSHRLATVRWHSSDPLHTIAFDENRGISTANRPGRENMYIISCEDRSHDSATLTKTELLERCQEACGPQGAQGVLEI
ncbi:hypothetical protein [Mycolicibacterium novocastrense]|uniref:hypothetical protein n=1 Tax=Mycolicibacterium novocastrense TaxID=59813 RepID=UPI000A69B188|nr:hypothetical protein [Mycolicibacterium novocastrense]